MLNADPDIILVAKAYDQELNGHFRITNGNEYCCFNHESIVVLIMICDLMNWPVSISGFVIRDV